MTVESFEKLPMDMKARVAKVYDVNTQLCALIKIETTEQGFYFQGAVEKSEQMVGEIYVFVSPGIRFLTITHQKFGVIRNYEFPQTIESGVVYRMKLLTEEKEVKIDTSAINKAVDNKIDAKMEELNRKLAELEQLKADIKNQSQTAETPAKPRPVYNKETFLMLNGAYSVAPQTSVGITFGMQKTWGWYASVASGFNFDNLDPNPPHADIDGTGYFYDGGQTSSRLSLHAGVLYRVAKPLSIKVGFGYGVRNSAFSTYNEENILIKNNSHNGLEYSAGVHLSFGRLAFSADVLGVGLKFKYSEIKIGIGYNLKIKKQENKKGE